MTSLTVRPATPADTGVILRFVRDLAAYENAADEVVASEEAIRASLFAEDATVHAAVAEMDGTPIGFAVYFFSFSTWQGRHGLYLEDIYVTPACRGIGAGKALMRHLAKIALERGCGRFEWSVLDWNAPTIQVYERLGAEPQSEWIRYRLEGESLERLARS